MPSIQILYDPKDHQSRAEALMNSLANDAKAAPVGTPTGTTKPVTVAGLNTLIIWGHGSHTGLCDKNGKEIVAIIKAWKVKNSDLKTVEIITCNSRHFDDSWLKGTEPEKHLKSMLTHIGSRIDNSMAKQVKRGLKYSFDPSIREIKVKTMPQSVRGSYTQYSILYWEEETPSWAYVTGPSEAEMRKIGLNILQTKKIPPEKGKVWGKAREGDFPTRLAAAKVDFPGDDYTDVLAGRLPDLRTILVEVH